MKKSGKKIKESKLAQDWFNIGEEELKFARAGFEDIGAFYAQICFLCQQSAEKYLKGFLIYSKTEFPKIHDLVELVKLCARKDKKFLDLLDDAAVLSQYYLISRYPIEYKPAGKKEAQEALNIAEALKDFILAKI